MPEPVRDFARATLAAAAALVAISAIVVVVKFRADSSPAAGPQPSGGGPAAPVTARPFGAEAAEEAHPVPTGADPLVAVAVEQLGVLAVAEPVWEGYDRDLFEHWTVDEASGCDTRRLVLIAQAVRAPDVGAGCRLDSGAWVSPYDDLRFEGYGAGVEIDHLVPLAEAWRSGAWAWPHEMRRAYANDSRSLVAVSAASNQDKLAAGPERWLPPDADAHCWYAAAWVQTKHRWTLSVDPDERDALVRVLAACDSPAAAEVPG